MLPICRSHIPNNKNIDPISDVIYYPSSAAMPEQESSRKALSIVTYQVLFTLINSAEGRIGIQNDVFANSVH